MSTPTVLPGLRALRLRRVLLLIGLSTLVVVAAAFGAEFAMAFGSLPHTAVNPTQVAIIYVVVAICVALYVLVAALSPVPEDRGTFWARVIMTTLALAAPICVVLTLRLGFEACLVLNPLGLPWPSAIKAGIRVLSVAVVASSIAGLVMGSRRRELRAASLVLLVYSAIISLPTFFFFVLTVYGDPGPHCVSG